MGRYSTGAISTNECRKIKMSYLLENGLLKKGARVSGVISWTDESRISIICQNNHEGNEKYIRLLYTNTDRDGNKKEYDYRVNITSIPSNLGKGEVLYFICPITYKRCRVLYGGAYGSPIYKSREAYSHRIYYKCQYQSKNYYWLIRYNDTKEQLEKLTKIAHKSHYKNKPTKLLQRIEYLEKMLQYYDEMQEEVLDEKFAIWLMGVL